MAEIWRPIPALPNYEASSEGNIKHIRSQRPRKPYRGEKGYLAITAWANGRHWVYSVHVLVASAFHGPRPEGQEVRHLDGDPGNDRPTNLKYGTKVENAADRERHGHTCRGQRNGNSRLSDFDADCIRLIYGAKEATQYELAAMFNISQAQVNNIVLGKQRLRHAASPPIAAILSQAGMDVEPLGVAAQ